MLFNPAVQIIVLCVTTLLIAKGIYIPHVQYEVFSVLFGIIVINLAINPKNILNLEYKALSYLGKISFGLYMYHFIVIVIVFKSLSYFNIDNDLILYPLVLTFTTMVAGLSYTSFEKSFIRKKVKFSDVISGEAAKSETAI